MKTSIDKYEFISWYKNSGSYSNHFTTEGLSSLFDYLSDLEENMGQEINFDPIAFACEYNEYESLEEFNCNYNLDCHSLEDVSNYTIVFEVERTSRFIIRVF